MNIHRRDESALTPSDRRRNLKKASQVFLWLFILFLLFFVGFAIELGPKWPSGRIHISIAPGHGFTDQDAVALIPFSIGIVWFGIGIGKNQRMLKNYIRKYPEKSFVIALIIGLTLGLLIGIVVGAIFETYITYFYRQF